MSYSFKKCGKVSQTVRDFIVQFRCMLLNNDISGNECAVLPAGFSVLFERATKDGAK